MELEQFLIFKLQCIIDRGSYVVSKGKIYQHFPSLEVLQIHAMTPSFKRFRESKIGLSEEVDPTFYSEGFNGAP